MHYSYSIFVFMTIGYTYSEWTRIFIRPQPNPSRLWEMTNIKKYKRMVSIVSEAAWFFTNNFREGIYFLKGTICKRKSVSVCRSLFLLYINPIHI